MTVKITFVSKRRKRLHFALKFCNRLDMRVFRRLFLYLMIGMALTACERKRTCIDATFEGLPFTLCQAASASDMRLFLKDGQGALYGSFDALTSDLEKTDRQLIFAMNAGMYHANRDPVGLYIEKGVEMSKLNTNAGPGNFHLLPNGVFWLGQDRSGVTAADHFKPDGVEYATQSGPMLVIENKLHPAFRADSTSLRIRNGVGQTVDGRIYFVKSELPVNFHSFARFFRDELKTPNALFLDGTVSKLYSDELGRNDRGQDMGPIIGVIEAVP